MREKQVYIKYRYARHEEETSIRQDDDNYQWYLIDLSEQINNGEIESLSFQELVSILRQDNAQFCDNNIKLKNDIYWITIGEKNFDMDFTIDEEFEQADDIILLLERQKTDQQTIQDNQMISNLQKNLDKIGGIVEKVCQKQNDFFRYFQLDNDQIIFKDIIEDILSIQLERQKEGFREILNQYFYDYYVALSKQIESKQIQPAQINYQNNIMNRSQNQMNGSSQFMDQSFQFKPQQHQFMANQQQAFNFQIPKNDSQNYNNQNIQQSIDFDLKKQDTKESVYSNDMVKQQSIQMKFLEQSEIDSALLVPDKANIFGNFIKEEDTRQKVGSGVSDGALSSILHMDSKRVQHSSIFNPNGLQSKSESQKNQENSQSIQNGQGSNPDIEGKEDKPIFQIKFPDFTDNKVDDSDGQGQNTHANPFIFNIPTEDRSNSPEIDFFKAIKPAVAKGEKQQVSSQLDSSEPQGKLIEEQSSNQNKPTSSNQNLNIPIKNTLQPSTVNAKNKRNFLTQDINSQMNNSSIITSHEANDSSNNIFSHINKKNNPTTTNNNNNNNSKDKNTEIQTIQQTRNPERRSSKHYRNENRLVNSTSGGNNTSTQKGKPANITDMTIMYSEPIVKISQIQVQGAQPQVLPAGDPVDYELEIQKLNEFLKETNKQIKLDIVVASLDNLEKSFTRNTQILHIMCHGDYSEKEQQYYLAFEDEESKLDTITSKRFQEFLKQKNCNVKLVFFNACHSEEVGKIFQEAGIPFVIAVQSDLKIEDKAALTFSSSFYMNIFSGRSVLESFESAKISLQAKQHEGCFTCCCAHSHDSNCLWFEEAMNNGFDEAHENHKPQSKCKCILAKRMIHEINCEWAHEFLKKYKDNYDDYIDEVIENGDKLFACCCHGIETPHDESLKFRLIKNPAQEDCKIMSDLPEGNIIEKSNLDFNHPIFQDQSKIFGRNLEIYKIYKFFMNNNKFKSRFVALHGGLGTGKTAVAKKVARHLKERGQVVEIIFEDFERMKTKFTKFEQKMRLGYHTKEVAYSHLKDKKVLFILDNCDDLIKNNKFKFETTINELAQNTTAKFLIISHEKYDLKLGQGQIPQITLGQLNDYYVKQLIEFYAGDTIREYSNNPQFNEQLSELIRIMPKSPKSIMETVQNITENMDISQILTSLKSNQISDRQKDYTAFNLLMKDLKQANQSAYDMLLLISLFPHGVSVEDLKFLERKKKIPHEWIKLMESLTLYSNEITNRASELSLHDLPDITGVGLKRMQSKRMTIFQLNKQDDDNMEEDDFDNDQQHEESYRYKKFKNGQYFWMSVSRKFDVVVFRIKKFVVEQLKQQEYREDLFHKEILVLEYLSIFSKKLLHNLKEKSHHQERLMEYCSLSHSGIFGVHYSQNQLMPLRGGHQQSSKSAKLAETGESDYEHGDNTPENLHNGNREYSEDRKLGVVHRDSVHLEKKVSDNTEQKLFKSLSPLDIFKLHEGNFYSYLNVEDHRQIIAYINSKQCEEKKKQKIKKHIQDLCVNIPSIHKLLDELSTSEEQCVQAELVVDELLKNHQNSQFLIAKAKLLFLKISLYVEKFISDQNISIEDVIHRDEIDSINEEVDKKFADFDKNEIFIFIFYFPSTILLIQRELVDIEKQFIIFYLIYVSFKKNRENELSHTFEQILKVTKDPRFNGVKGKVNLMLESLIPKLLTRIKELKKKEDSIDDEKKDIKMGPNNLSVLESKMLLLNSLLEVEFNTQFQLRFQELEEAIKVFETNQLNSLMIQTTIVYCKKKLNGLKNSRDTQNLIKLKKEMIDPALNNSKMWKLTSLEADCKKILGEINDQLHHISSNVFQFMKTQPIIYQDKKTPYGHIIRLNQSFKRRLTDILSKSGKELNLKFEIQTIKHFKECLQRGSKFMCLSCDDAEDDGIIVEEDQLPLMRKYKEQEMEEYYKQHYEEFGQIEILMLCSPNGLQLKEMFCRIIDKVNAQIRKMQNNPDKKQSKSKSSDDNKGINENKSGKEKLDRDSELRRRPTIIAFQFKSNKRYQRASSTRKHTIFTPSQSNNESGDQSNASKRNKNKGNFKNGKEQNFTEEADIDEYEDFYLYYLREFATQQFQFEFLTQLLQDKPDPNPQSHIRKAFNYAKQKMVEATITVCSEDIRDEQTFEQILGKGPDLYLSDDWMDAKYEFRKGQIIDITSERPPQNLNRNFLRISGRKQDIYIILQKIQESCVNIFGQVGIGKSIVAQQIAYFTFSRNTFCDGVYYFSLKQLPNFNYDLRNLMQSLLGQQFSQDVSEYFQNQKKMLLIFDDFDMILNSFTKQEYKIKFFEYLFFYINKFEVHYILVTQKSLRPLLEQKNCPFSCIKSNMHYHEVKLFSRKESLNFLDSLLDLESINIKKVIDNRKNFEVIYKKAQGNPKKLIEQYCKKFGNPKIPKQFILNSQQPIILQSPTTLNLGPFNQTIPNIPIAHNNMPQFPQRKKPLIANQKSREFNNQPTPAIVPQLNMMQLNTANQNYNANYTHSNPSSARQNYLNNYAGSDQNQLYNSNFQTDSSLPNSHLFQQHPQKQYNSMLTPIQKTSSQFHQQYYNYNKLNHSQSQSLVLNNNLETSSSSLIYHPNQAIQMSGTYTDRNKGSSNQIYQNQKQQQSLQKITQSGMNLKSSDHIKHKSSKTLINQQNQHDHHSQLHNYQMQNSSYVSAQYNPHHTQQKIHQNNYQGSSHSHHMSHPSSQSLVIEPNLNNSTGNTPSLMNPSYPPFQQTTSQFLSKKSLNINQSQQYANNKLEIQKSNSKEGRIHSHNIRNKLEIGSNNIVVQSDPEAHKTSQIYNDSHSNQISNFIYPNNQNNMNSSDYSIISHNQNLVQFDQEDFYHNQLEVDNYDMGQDDDDKTHKREASGTQNGIKQQNQIQGLYNSGSLISLTQDNLHQSLSNLNNSAHLGSANNGSQSSRKLKKSHKKNIKYPEKHIQEEISLCQSIVDDDDESNAQYSSKSRDLEKLNSAEFMKELFGQSKTETEVANLSNSQSLQTNNTKTNTSNQNLKQSLYGNDQNFSSNGVPFEYQVNNIEEEEEPKSDDEFLNLLEIQKNQERMQAGKKNVQEEIIPEETKEYIMQSSFNMQSEMKQKNKDLSFEFSKGGNFTNFQDMISSTQTDKFRQEESPSNKGNKSSSKQRSKQSSLASEEYAEENYLPQEIDDKTAKMKLIEAKHQIQYSLQDQVVDSSEEQSNGEEGYQEEDEEGELNEDDDMDEKQSKEQYQQNIFFSRNELRVKDDDIEDQPQLKSLSNKDHQSRTPDKNYLTFQYQMNTNQLNLSPPPQILPISPSQVHHPHHPHHQYNHQQKQQGLIVQHYSPYIRPQQVIDQQIHHNYATTPHHAHHQMSSQYLGNQQKQVKQGKMNIKETISDRQNSEGLNNSFISNYSNQINNELNEQGYHRSKSNTSLPSMLQVQKSDSQTSKATIQSAGHQEQYSIKQFNTNNNSQNNQETINKKNSKKKVNQSGKQAQVFNKKKKNKYKDYKAGNQQAKSSSNESGSDD